MRNADYSIREENSGAKLMDGILGGIPVVGMASGYLFHPRYLITRRDGQPVMRLTKQPAFREGRFSIDKPAGLEPREELNLLLSFLMLLMIERKRG